jgi:hypothetical protein
MRHPLRQLLPRSRRHCRPQSRGQDQPPIGQCRLERRISCKPRCSINLRSCGGKSRPHVFRQGEPAAYRHSREITIRPRPTSRLFEIRCFLRDPAMSAIAKNHPDPASPPTRCACADLKLLPIQRMAGVDNPDYGWQSFQSFRYCGIMLCSASRPLPRHPRPHRPQCTPASAQWRQFAQAQGAKTRHRLTGNNELWNRSHNQRATRHPGGLQSECLTDFNRNPQQLIAALLQ